LPWKLVRRSSLPGWNIIVIGVDAGRAGRAGRLAGHTNISGLEARAGGEFTSLGIRSSADSCQPGVRYRVARQGRGSGFTIGKDGVVAVVISLFHPGRVRGLGHGKSMDAGD